jgi:chaperone modulatory protein CbpM
MNDSFIELSMTDMCEAVKLPEQTFVELVEHGIIIPSGEHPSVWSFDLTMLSVAKRATRLHRDLELDWEAVALIVELIEERNQLQAENTALKQRLQRFVLD